jgi:hypothetical protein
MERELKVRSKESAKRYTMMVAGVIVILLMLPAPVHLVETGFAGEHSGREDHSRHMLSIGKHGHRLRGHDEGNETTGQIAAWLLAAANLTVALSILSKTATRFIPLRPEVRSALADFNRFQKKHLMRFHYLLNPAAMSFALLHWLLSRCRSNSFPEWSLVSFCLLAGLGLVMKFKLSPPALRKSIYALHSHPLVLPCIILVLIIGHASMD